MNTNDLFTSDINTDELRLRRTLVRHISMASFRRVELTNLIEF